MAGQESCFWNSFVFRESLFCIIIITMTRSQTDLTNTKLHDQDDRKPKSEKKTTKKGATTPKKAAKVSKDLIAAVVFFAAEFLRDTFLL